MVVICCHIYLWLITYPCMKIENPQNSLDRGQINNFWSDQKLHRILSNWQQHSDHSDLCSFWFNQLQSQFTHRVVGYVLYFVQLFTCFYHRFVGIWHLHIGCWSLYWWNHHFCGSKSPFSWSIVFPKSSYACFFPKELYCQVQLLTSFTYITYIINIYILFPSFSIFIVSNYFITCSEFVSVPRRRNRPSKHSTSSATEVGVVHRAPSVGAVENCQKTSNLRFVGPPR